MRSFIILLFPNMSCIDWNKKCGSVESAAHLRKRNWILFFCSPLVVFKNIVEVKRDEVNGDFMDLHKEGWCDFYSHQIYIVKSRRLRWAGHVTWKKEPRYVYRSLVKKLYESGYFEEWEDCRKILGCREYVVRMGGVWNWLRVIFSSTLLY
jgi:hypothetical protein